MSTLRLAFPLVALAFLWTSCGNADAQEAGQSSTIAKRQLLSLNFTNNGQHVTATVGQRIEIRLGTVGPKQYSDPQVSSPAIRLESVALDWPPNPGGATLIYMLEAAAEGEAEVKVPITNNWPNLPLTKDLTFAVTIRVRPSAGNLPGLHASLTLDQANTAPWKNGWTNLHNLLRQTFTPSLPTLTGVEVELVVANPGPASGQVTMALENAEGHALALVSKTVPVDDCRHVLFVFPNGGLRVSAGQVYSIELSGSGSLFGWKYVVGGYANGAASLLVFPGSHGFSGRPLFPDTRSTFLFRTFGAS